MHIKPIYVWEKEDKYLLKFSGVAMFEKWV